MFIKTKNEKRFQWFYMGLLFTVMLLNYFLGNSPDASLSIALNLLIIYIFAVRKPGTFWLSLSIFFNIFGMLSIFYNASKHINSININAQPDALKAALLSYVFVTGIYAIGLAVNIIFRKINFNIQITTLEHETPTIFDEWKQAENGQALSDISFNLSQKYPNYKKAFAKKLKKDLKTIPT